MAVTDSVFSVNGLNTDTNGAMNLLGSEYIAGLQMIWVSGTALTVKTGSACRPSDGLLLRPAADLAKTGLALTASTWYHVYLYLNGSTPDVEIVTTAPSAPYFGTARSKTADTSRRYIGSVLTDASSLIINFLQTGNAIKYLANLTAAPLRVLSAGVSTSRVMVALTAAVPVTTAFSSLVIRNTTTTSGTLVIDVPETGFTGSTVFNQIAPASNVYADIPTKTQTVAYIFTTAVTGGSAFIDVAGYVYER